MLGDDRYEIRKLAPHLVEARIAADRAPCPIANA